MKRVEEAGKACGECGDGWCLTLELVLEIEVVVLVSTVVGEESRGGGAGSGASGQEFVRRECRAASAGNRQSLIAGNGCGQKRASHALQLEGTS